VEKGEDCTARHKIQNSKLCCERVGVAMNKARSLSYSVLLSLMEAVRAVY
jgi:hypothetical protein